MLPHRIVSSCVLVLVAALGACAPAREARTPTSTATLTSAPLHGASLVEPPREDRASIGGPPSATPLTARSAKSALADQLAVEATASAVLRELHGDLLACYRARLRTHPRAHASLDADLLVGADGRVRDVTTTGGALLGRAARRCIEGRLRRAAFVPLQGGGTSRVRVPFAFHPAAAFDEPRGDRAAD